MLSLRQKRSTSWSAPSRPCGRAIWLRTYTACCGPKARRSSSTPRRMQSSRSKWRRICASLLVRRTSLSRIGVLTQGPLCRQASPQGPCPPPPTVVARHWLPRGARLGIDIGGVLMRIGDVRHPEQCGFRPGAEDWVAMMISELGATNTHIISRVSGSGARLKVFLESSGFLVRTGFLPEDIHFCRHRSGVQGKGMVFRRLNLTHFVDARIECLTEIATRRKGRQCLFSESDHVRQRPG